MPTNPFDQQEVWFLTGSQHLYGTEVLKEVQKHADQIAAAVEASGEVPLRVVCKPVLTTPESIRSIVLEANAAENCVGLITWMHTFSPAKMWIGGLGALQKPMLHLHTQFNREIPWSSIDMDFMNLNQSAHGGREFGVYAQLDFDTDIAGRRFRGNFGVRSVETELTSTGLQNGEVEVTVENEYRDTLPSMNLVYELSDDVILRGSAAKVMSRPNLGTLSPGGSVGTFGDPRVSYGNPFIEPFRAKAYDLGAEWYFAEDAVVSVAYFVKDIESLPISQTDVMSWAETGLPDSLLGAQYDDLYNADFEVRRTVNGDKGGELDGWELQYQQPLTFLPGPDWVRNFGILANLTKVNSEVTYKAGEPDEFKGPLSGQSDDSSNLTLYWENDVFSARLSMANRGEYSTRPQETNKEKRRYVDATSFLDFSASYRVTDNLKVNFEAINLTDEPVFSYMDGNAKRMINEISTGAQYFVGAQYKF